MMNPIALGMLALGILLLMLGLRLFTSRRKGIGLAIALLGVGTMTAPFFITFFLLR
jgi:hypothetical protein